jgi:hypothetical protein
VRASLALIVLGTVACGAAPPVAPPIDVARPVAVASERPPLQVAGDGDPGHDDDERARIQGAVMQARCADERRLRSHESNTSLHIDYQNDRPRKVSLYWLDFDGRRVHYADLEPGQGYRQQTYVTHPWVAVDGDGRCRAVFVPQGGGEHAVVIGGR